MNIKGLIIAAISLAAALETASAEVFIYRGTIKARTDYEANNLTLASASQYLIVDYDARKFADISYGKIATGKVYVGSAPVLTAMLTAPVSKTATETVFANGAMNPSNVDNFNFGTYFISGRNGSIITKKVPVVTRAIRPLALKGTAATTFSAPGQTPRFSQKSFTARLDATATIRANEAGKTIEVVNDEIIQGLKDLGYTLFSAQPGR